jgi:2-polyprenyl-3-methyl-5-hydroxy-6-metoxy-1,4-benzoquinol methylase
MTTLTEESIRPRQLMADKQSAVEADRQFLLARRRDWVEADCPACDSRRRQTFGAKAGFEYALCADCATVYTRPRPSQELLHEFYAGSKNYEYWNRHIFPATAEVRRARIFRPRAERVVEYCHSLEARQPVLLEVGAGFGLFCEEAARLGFFDRVIALEPTPGLAETCRRKGLEVLETPVELLTADPFVDVIAAFEVLEHLFSPRRFIERCATLLRPDGLLVLTCPNVQGFDVATLGLRSGTFDHEHLNYFHPGSLPRLLERCGFRVVDVSTPGRLDAELVRERVLAGDLSLDGQPFLRRVLLDQWETLGPGFQDWLAANRLSSHLWVIAQKPRPHGAAAHHQP